MGLQRSQVWRVVSAIALLGSVACGGGGGGDPGGGGSDPVVSDAQYFPLAVGDRWRYIANGETDSVSTVRVVGTQQVTGGTAFVLRTQDAAGSFDEFYLKTAEAVSLIPSAASDPLTKAVGPFDLMRFPLVAGSSFVSIDKTLRDLIDADGDGRADTLEIRAEVSVVGFESVTTPVRSFANALHLRTEITQVVTLSSNGQRIRVPFTSDDWYAPGVGLVRNATAEVFDGNTVRTELLVQVFKAGTQHSEDVAPTVLARTPEDGSSAKLATVGVTFSEAMEPSSLPAGGFTVVGPGGSSIAGSAVWSGDRNLDFVAGVALASGAYTATLAASVEDMAGNHLPAPVVWRFTVDTEGPKVTARSPAPDAIEVPLASAITITFDEPLDLATVSPGTIWLESALARVDTTLSVQGRVVTMTPSSPLRQGTEYRAWISQGVRDTLGNTIGSDINWRFKSDPGRFAAPIAIPALGVPTAIELADVDGDGRLDVVAAEGNADGSRRVLLLRQQANGTLGPIAQQLPTTAGCTPWALALADFDADGRLDVAVSALGCGIEIIAQTSSGGWTNQGFLTQENTYAVRAVPLVGQTRPGIVATIAGRLVLWRPAVSGGYQAPVDLYPNGYGLGDIAVGDVNGDGRVDIVAIGGLDIGAGLVIARQRADGAFDIETVQAVNATVNSVAVGDVNGDGRSDIVYLLASPPGPAVVVLRQTPAGLLAAATFEATSANPASVRIADVDGNARMDIVVGHESSGTFVVGVHMQSAAGSLASEETFEAPGMYSNSGLAVGDLSSDGRADILVHSALLKQRSPTAAPSGLRAGARRWLTTAPRASGTY